MTCSTNKLVKWQGGKLTFSALLKGETESAKLNSLPRTILELSMLKGTRRDVLAPHVDQFILTNICHS